MPSRKPDRGTESTTENKPNSGTTRRGVLGVVAGSTIAIAGCGDVLDDDESAEQDDDDDEPTDNGDDEPTDNGDDEPTDDEGVGAEEDDERTTIEVPADNSIQDAVADVAAGGEIRLTGNLYEQTVELTKPVTLTGVDGATLDGEMVDGDDEAAIVATEGDVSITNLEVRNFEGNGITTNSSVTDLTVTDVTIEDVGGHGIGVVVADDGTATFEDIDVLRSGGSGVALTDGESITIESAELTQNDANGIAVETDLTRNQSVTIEDVDLFEQNEIGLAVSGSSDVDISTVTAVETGGSAVDVTATDVTVTDVTATEPEDDAIDIDSDDDGVVDLQTLDLTDPSGDGVDILDGSTVTVDDIDIQSASTGVDVNTDTARGRSVTITDGFLEHGGAGIAVSDTTGDDELVVADVELQGARLQMTGSHEDVTVDGVTVTDAETRASSGIGSVDFGNAGVHVKSSADGDVTVSNTTVLGTSDRPGRAILIEDGASITVDEVETAESRSSGLRIRSDNARGQSVALTDSLFQSDRVEYYGSGGEDELTVEGVELREYATDTTAGTTPLYAEAETVVLRNVETDPTGDTDGNIELDIGRSGEAVIESSTIGSASTGFGGSPEGASIFVDGGDSATLTLDDVTLLDDGFISGSIPDENIDG